MRTRTLTHEITGRMILPTGIMFLTMLIIPIALFIMPTGRHLFPYLGLDYYIMTCIMTSVFVLCYLIGERTK